MESSRKVKQTLKELSKLNDRELQDIGIGRSDIWRVAEETKHA